MKLLILACLLPAALAVGGLVGGISETKVDPTYPPVQYAVHASNDYLTSQNLLGAGQTLDLTKILRARTQVVAGENLYLDLLLGGEYICNVTVWYRAWVEDAQKFQITSGPVCNKAAAQEVRRQLGGMPGGVSQPESLDHAPKQVLDALDFAMCAVNDASNSMFLSVLGDKSSITYTHQVTSGMTYVFHNVNMVESGCRKVSKCAEVDNLDSCVPNHDGTSNTCTLTVQFQAWMNPAYTLGKMDCH